MLEVILLYLTAGESYGTTASLLNLTTDMSISKTAVYFRIIGSWKWLKWLAESMCAQNELLMPKPDWLDREVVAVDGSEMGVKGSKQGDYRLVTIRKDEESITEINFAPCVVAGSTRPRYG